MELRFEELIKRNLPTGKAWEYQDNFNHLIGGSAVEFGRLYEDVKAFHTQFNIVESYRLATNHGEDYLLDTELFTRRELQRIIVKYIHQNYSLEKMIRDFGNFIGVPIDFDRPPPPFEFGVSRFGEEFGDPEAKRSSSIYLEIHLGAEVTCLQYRKLVWLINYFKPPYLYVMISNKPDDAIRFFQFGVSTFNQGFGDIIPCEVEIDFPSV